MNKLRYICCLTLTAVVLSGCSVFKPVQKTELAIYNGHNQSEEPINQKQEDNFGQKDRDIENDRTPLQRKTNGLVKEPGESWETDIAFRPVISFGEIECQNVRLPAGLNNPFPVSGELIIPLEDLASEFCYPLKGRLISKYGYRGRSMHTGIDLKAIPNDTIRAAMPGVVRMSKPYSGYGNIIVIRHYNGLETVYAHQSKNLVTVNDVVEAGSPIGLAGRTGRATTEHLHFEVRVGGEHINPAMFIDPEAMALRTDTLYVYNRTGKVLAYNSDKSSDIYKTASGNVVVKSLGNASIASSSDVKYHVIKSGDTLSGLARKYSTTVNKICELNNIKPSKVLQLKERLRVG